jgi:excinuclease UvrABC ATPase subunit
VRLAGRSVAEYVRLSIADARPLLAGLTFVERERPVADRVVQEIVTRLQFLESLGLGYLTLDRPTTTRSGGEAHRIRLATQIGARMQGILAFSTSPRWGCTSATTGDSSRPQGHPRPARWWWWARRGLIRAADWIVDLGRAGTPGRA